MQTSFRLLDICGPNVKPCVTLAELSHCPRRLPTWPSYTRGPMLPRGKVNHHASPEARLPFPSYLATCPAADRRKLPHSSTLPTPASPPLGRRPTNNIISGAAAICGVEHEVRVTSGAPRLACAARSPQEPSETSTPPRRRGAPGGTKHSRRPFSPRSGLHYSSHRSNH